MKNTHDYKAESRLLCGLSFYNTIGNIRRRRRLMLRRMASRRYHGVYGHTSIDTYCRYVEVHPEFVR